MTEKQFPIRQFDPNKKAKRVRRVDPPANIPSNVDEWNNLHSLRRNMNNMRKDLSNITPFANNFDDPVVSRALLTIHYALMRIDSRTFRVKVDGVLRKHKEQT